MKLLDRDPRWFDVPGVGTRKDGITFLCPCKKCLAGDPVRLGVQFINPVGDTPFQRMSSRQQGRHVHVLKTFDILPGKVWQRVGDTLETISIFPSIDASGVGHWHGYIHNGELIQ